MISRIDVSSPPGVSICSTTSCAPSRSARTRLRVTKSALAGPIAPASGNTITGAGAALAYPTAIASHAHPTTISFTILTRTALRNPAWTMIIAENALTRAPASGARAGLNLGRPDGLPQSPEKQRDEARQQSGHRSQPTIAGALRGGELLQIEIRHCRRRGEFLVYQTRQLRQHAGEERRFFPQPALERPPADLVLHPALEEGLGRHPEVQVRVELPTETLDIEQRLLQQHKLWLDLDVEAARCSKQLHQYARERDF